MAIVKNRGNSVMSEAQKAFAGAAVLIVPFLLFYWFCSLFPSDPESNRRYWERREEESIRFQAEWRDAQQRTRDEELLRELKIEAARRRR
jgi:hypothetical protein